jgi:glycosyltransferase involved in cell wall biosynthesis
LLRLLNVTPYFDTHLGHLGGIQVGTSAMNRRLAVAGFQVTWMASGVAPSNSPHGPRIIPIGAHHGIERITGAPFPVPTWRGLARIAGEAADTDVAIVHNHNNLISLAATVALRLGRKPFVIVEHSGYGYEGGPWLKAAAAAVNCSTMFGAKLADRVIFVSESLRRQWSWPGMQDESAVIPNGVDKALFAPASPQRRLRARRALRLPPDARIGLFAGRFAAGKGLDAIERLAALRPEIIWVLVGDGRIDPTSWMLPNVEVFGRVAHPRMPQFFHCGDFVILPSRREGHPLVVLEALACGLPVVTSLEVARIFDEPDVVGVPIDGDAEADAGRMSIAVDRIRSGPPPFEPGSSGLSTWDDISVAYANLLHDLWCSNPDTAARARAIG